MPQDPWAEFRVGGPAAPPPQAPQAPGVIYGAPDPYKQANEQRAQQDQAFQAEQLRLSQAAAARADAEARRSQAEFEGTGGKPTETDKKGASFLIRAIGANVGYEDTGQGARNIASQAFQDTAPDISNTFLNGDARQVADAAQRAFVMATLRQDSGAAIPPEEIESQIRTYFPNPGDGEEVIKFKKRLREQAIEGLRMTAGPEAQDAERRIREMLDRYRAEDKGDLIGYDADRKPVYSSSAYVGQLYDEQGNPTSFLSGGTDGSPSPGGGGSGQPNGDGGGPGMGTIATNIQNTLAGAAQGAAGLYDFPMQVAQGVRSGVNYAVGQGGGAALNAMGLPGAADWWRQGSSLTQQNIDNMPTAAGAIERISPTPEGYEPSRFVSQLVGGAMVPLGPKTTPRITAPVEMGAISRTAAQDVVQAGKDAGVRVMTSDVRPPKTFIGQVARATGERIPIAGTAGPRAAQQRERVEAVKDLAKDFGADVANNYLDEIAADLATTRGGQITALAKAKNAVIDGVRGKLPPVALLRTLKAIDAQVKRLSRIDADTFGPVIDKLTAFGANIASGKTLREVEGNRKLLGDMFEDPNLASAKGDGQKAINAIYGPLREDMGAFIKQAAGTDAYNKWASANKRLSALAGELDSTAFKNVLKKAETTPEQVSRLLFNKQPSEVRKLYTNLSPEGQAKARAGLIHLAIEKADGIDNISPDKFAKAIADNSKAAGVIFHGADLQRLEGLQRLLQATKRAAVASAAPPTGVQNAPLIGAGVSFAAFGPKALAVIGSYGGLARLYESAATRNLLIGLSKTKPGTKAEGEWLQRILKAASTQVDNMGNAANDIIAASPPRAAAQDENNPR